jgi:hypothetical protein
MQPQALGLLDESEAGIRNLPRHTHQSSSSGS